MFKCLNNNNNNNNLFKSDNTIKCLSKFNESLVVKMAELRGVESSKM